MTVSPAPERPAGRQVDRRVIFFDNRGTNDFKRILDRIAPPCGDVPPLAIDVNAAAPGCGMIRGQGRFSGNLRTLHPADGCKPKGDQFDRVVGIGVRKTLGVLGVETKANLVDTLLVDRGVAPRDSEFEGLTAITQVSGKFELPARRSNTIRSQPCRAFC